MHVFLQDFQKSIAFLIDQNIVKVANNTIEQLAANNLSSILLSAVAPFICSYFEVCHTVKLEFSEASEFNEHHLLVALQRRVEMQLYSGKNQVHPYSLALDTAIVAVGALVQNNILRRIRQKEGYIYRSIKKNVLSMDRLLNDYVNILPFATLNSFLIFSKI